MTSAVAPPRRRQKAAKSSRYALYSVLRMISMFISSRSSAARPPWRQRARTRGRPRAAAAGTPSAGAAQRVHPGRGVCLGASSFPRQVRRSPHSNETLAARLPCPAGELRTAGLPGRRAHRRTATRRSRARAACPPAPGGTARASSSRPPASRSSRTCPAGCTSPAAPARGGGGRGTVRGSVPLYRTCVRPCSRLALQTYRHTAVNLPLSVSETGALHGYISSQPRPAASL